MIGSSNDICRELYEAREQLADRGSWSRNNCYNWNQYLQDVGLQRELYEAREQLSHWGGDKSKLTSGNLVSWQQYLQDVGLAYRTVHR